MTAELDSEIAAILGAASAIAAIDVSTLPPVEAARLMRSQRRIRPPPVRGAARVEDRRIAGSGRDIPIRIYWPSGPATGAVVDLHGGGWVMGDLESDDYLCHHLAAEAGCVVVSVDYRLAPEHPFPQPLDDCFEAAVWTHAHAGELGFDPDRIALVGTSSGGALAAACALQLRDRGGFRPCFQLLIYPVCDASCAFPSFFETPAELPLNRTRMQWFWDQYAPDAAVRAEPYVSPLRAKDFSRLPPTHVLTAELDPLRDEGEAYAARLAASAIAATVTRAAGAVHGFLTLAPNAAVSRRAMDEIASRLRAGLTARTAVSAAAPS